MVACRRRSELGEARFKKEKRERREFTGRRRKVRFCF